MSLHYSKDGDTFNAHAGSLTIEPRPRPTPLNSGKLMKPGGRMRDECQMPLTCRQRSHGVIDSILAAETPRGVADGRRSEWPGTSGG